ncbi:hypothetical protein [Reyranella sp.]|uniref:hypothetical protein n=1 Tax=Reyranella sp. TaxID=1929291 RepID=UPI00273201CF|nr:hypothetical protein [Reyranella sp.]MDP2377813.1 hypothetical protein [Reyranella sp.]
MADRTIEPAAWPSSIAWILDELKESTHQNFRETQMDGGNVRRRPISSKVPILTGEVQLDEGAWRTLQTHSDLSAGTFLCGNRQVSFWTAPVVLQKTTRAGRPGETGYVVRIVLRLHDAAGGLIR